MYYTVIKHDRHLRTQGKCRKCKPQESVFSISQVDIGLQVQNNKTRFFYVLYCDIKHGFLTNQSARRVLSNVYYKSLYSYLTVCLMSQ